MRYLFTLYIVSHTYPLSSASFYIQGITYSPSYFGIRGTPPNVLVHVICLCLTFHNVLIQVLCIFWKFPNIHVLCICCTFFTALVHVICIYFRYYLRPLSEISVFSNALGILAIET